VAREISLGPWVKDARLRKPDIDKLRHTLPCEAVLRSLACVSSIRGRTVKRASLKNFPCTRNGR
jgi:hypothetical protein